MPVYIGQTLHFSFYAGAFLPEGKMPDNAGTNSPVVCCCSVKGNLSPTVFRPESERQTPHSLAVLGCAIDCRTTAAKSVPAASCKPYFLLRHNPLAHTPPPMHSQYYCLGVEYSLFAGVLLQRGYRATTLNLVPPLC